MKVIAFNGSAREKGNTYYLLNKVLDQLKKASIETKLIHLGNHPVQGCKACYKCKENKNNRCVLKDDPMNDYIKEMQEADGILLGSPTYCANVSTNMQAFLERAAFVSRANKDIFKYKVGAGVVAVRRCGGTAVFSTLNKFFLITQMIVPGSSYWNVGFGLNPGDVKNDEEAMRTMIDLGDNMAWLLKKLM